MWGCRSEKVGNVSRYIFECNSFFYCLSFILSVSSTIPSSVSKRGKAKSRNKYSTFLTVSCLPLSKMSQVNGTTEHHLSYSDSSTNLMQSHSNIAPQSGDVPSLRSLNLKALGALVAILKEVCFFFKILNPFLLDLIRLRWGGGIGEGERMNFSLLKTSQHDSALFLKLKVC